MTVFLCPYCGQSHRQGARFCNVTGKVIQAVIDSVPPVELMPGITGKLPPNHFLKGRFLILGKIGQGGMAAVYKAVDTTQPGELWAIKEMSDTAIPDPEEREYAVQAFLQEANLLRRLQHPNLPKVMDVFSEGGKYYLVMEYVHGLTLQEMLLERNSPFNELEVLPWAMQLCDVLDYLHSQNPKIIFRDLKPSNIMLTNQGQIKLIDFGIVRFFKPGKTKDTVALGTPGYASPESMSGQTDERSDVYSLCVTLHHLLTLHDPVSTIFNLPPLRKINPSISSDIENIIMCGVQNQRDRRWQSIPRMQIELTKLAYSQQRIPDLPSRIELVTASPGIAVGSQPGDSIVEKTVVNNIPLTPFSSKQPLGAQSLSGTQQAMSPSDARVGISRPTTRLVASVAKISGRQFSFLIILTILVIVIATWILAPLLDELPINWNNIPLIAVFGAFGYSAYPKRGMAFLSHALLSIVLIGTIWLKVGSQTYGWVSLFLGALISGLFMEVWLIFIPKIKGDRGIESWKREALWLSGMEVIGTAIFFEIVTQGYTGILLVQLITSAVLGVAGWFFGDFLREFVYFRKTGIKREI